MTRRLLFEPFPVLKGIKTRNCDGDVALFKFEPFPVLKGIKTRDLQLQCSQMGSNPSLFSKGLRRQAELLL